MQLNSRETNKKSTIQTNVPDHPPIELVAYYDEFLSYYPDCEMQTKKWVVDNVQPGWIIFDCGANIGYYTILFSRLVKNLGKIYAFEPTSTVNMLEENLVYHNISNVEIHQLALGKGSGALIDNIFRIWGKDPERQTYNFTTLDKFVQDNRIEKLDCIKIDVDSFDFEVLQGAEETLKTKDPFLIVELNHALNHRNQSNMLALEWMIERGYNKTIVLDHDNFVFKKSLENMFEGNKNIHVYFGGKMAKQENPKISIEMPSQPINTLEWAVGTIGCKDLILAWGPKYLTGIKIHRIMDFASGTNEEITRLAPHADEYYFLDEKFLPSLKQKYYLFKQAAHEKIPLPDNYLDVVTSNGSFDHFKQADRIKAFLEIERVLRPGGLFLFACEYIDFPEENRSLFFQQVQSDPDIVGRNCQIYDNINLLEICSKLTRLKIFQQDFSKFPDGRSLSSIVSPQKAKYFTGTSLYGTQVTWGAFLIVFKKQEQLQKQEQVNIIPEMNSFASQLREKWQEIPSTRQDRMFSAGLLGWSDDKLLAYWEECKQQTSIPEVRGWFQSLYRDSFAGCDIADIGSGIGIDGIYFAQHGARVTFVDIVENNLKVIERVCQLKRIQAEYYFIEDFFHYNFPHQFDVLMFIGSMHHAPFEFNQQQAQALVPFLRVGGKVVMLAYPKERYERLGAKDFAEFGKMTDGERTPWAEWYDDDKIKTLFGPSFQLNWSRNFGETGIEFNWFELTKIKEDQAVISPSGQASPEVPSVSLQAQASSSTLSIPTVSVQDLHKRLGFEMPLDYPQTSLIKSLDQWKMEIDDSPIFRYLYRHFQPRRHLEFGTWEGTGVTYCLEECEATVWTINLPFGENFADDSPAYRLYSSTLPEVRNWANKMGLPDTGFYRSDGIGFVGRFYLEKELGHRVCQIYCPSQRWDTTHYPPDFFDTVLIDGGHTKEVVLSDTRKAFQVLRRGGVVMWHDFCPPHYQQFESTRGVMEAMMQEWEWLKSQTSQLFWIYPSWILLAIKK